MAAASTKTASTRSTGFTSLRRCRDFLAVPNCGITRYSKMKINTPTLNILRTWRGILNRRFGGVSSGMLPTALHKQRVLESTTTEDYD
ncbi:unannotated protein [freshwater metagenome]|uniref:Unannotated protein n=1 Tax=freshwater metagenome TaxID=449393 RepID=A0A6J6VS22_9ZZZZ